MLGHTFCRSKPNGWKEQGIEIAPQISSPSPFKQNELGLPTSIFSPENHDGTWKSTNSRGIFPNLAPTFGCHICFEGCSCHRSKMCQPFARINRLLQVVRAAKIFGPSVPRPKIRMKGNSRKKINPKNDGNFGIWGAFFDLGGGGGGRIGLVGCGEHT